MTTFVMDTSVLAAIVFNEPEREAFLAKLYAASKVLISTASVLEARLVVQARKGQAGVFILNDILALPLFEWVAPAQAETDAAYVAAVIYGKGSGHPAQLNYGDLFSYATAKVRGLPLMFKGQDFSHTDLMAA
jgi:ribonuclease VapC